MRSHVNASLGKNMKLKTQKYREISGNNHPPYLFYSHNASHSVPVFDADNDDVNHKQDGGR